MESEVNINNVNSEAGFIDRLCQKMMLKKQQEKE